MAPRHTASGIPRPIPILAAVLSPEELEDAAEGLGVGGMPV